MFFNIAIQTALVVITWVDDHAGLLFFANNVGVAILTNAIELRDSHPQEQKNKAEALFRLLMERFFLATGAIFHFLHLIRMGTFIAGCDVVLFTTDCAF